MSRLKLHLGQVSVHHQSELIVFWSLWPFSPPYLSLFRIGKDFEDDLDFLLQGVSEFEIPGGMLASEVMVHGPLAFPIGTTSDGQAFLAGAYYGQGRVIVITHEGLMGREVWFH